MKKIGSFLLAMVFALAILPAAVQAAASNVYKENFDTVSEWDSNGYISEQSEIFERWPGNRTLSAAEGYSGSAAKFAKGGTYVDSALVVKTFSSLGYSEGKTFVYTSRIRFGGTPDSTFYMDIDHGTANNGYPFYVGVYDGKYTVASSSKTLSSGIALDDEWYNLIVIVSGSDITAKLYNLDGTLIRERTVTDSSLLTNANRAITYRFYNLNADSAVLIDDASLYCLESTDTFNFVPAESTAENTEIDRDSTLTLKFDQPINPATVSKITVKDSSDTVLPDAVESVLIKGFDTVELNLCGLGYGGTYTLDYSGVKSAGGAALAGENSGVFSFKTAAQKVFSDSLDTTSTKNSEIFQTGSYASATGYDGANAIKISSSTTTYLQTKTLVSGFGLDTDSGIVFNIRFKTSGEATENFSCQLDLGTTSYIAGYIKGNADGSYYFRNVNGKETAPLKKDLWYDMSVRISSAGNCCAAIYEQNTGEHVIDLSTGYNIAANRVFIFRLSNIGSTEMTFDDASLYRVDAADTVSLISSSVENGGMISENGTIELAFSQPMDKIAAVNVQGATVSDIKVKDFNKLVLSFDGLKNGFKTYTLDLSAVESAMGSVLSADSAASVSFVTGPDSDNDITLKGEAVCTSARDGGELTFELYSKSGANPVIAVAFYKGNVFEDIEIFSDVKTIAPGTSENFSVTLEKDHSDANRIKLFVLEELSSLVPLMEVQEITFPWEEIRVLMIGNSLSEDAGRYFNSVAEAGELTLDLTVKGIGGASLAHHAKNLEAELNGIEKNWERGEYFTYENGVFMDADDENIHLLNTLRAEKFDVISLQQFSAYTDSDFESSLPYLVTELRKLQPQAKIVLYQTWANYGSESTLQSMNTSFLNRIEPATKKWAGNVGIKIIPAGYAFYLGHNTYDFCMDAPYVTTDTDAEAKVEAVGIKKATGLMRDVNHASYYGCYLADAVWFEFLTGRQAVTTDSNGNAVVPTPEGIDNEEHISRLQKLSETAHKAVTDYKN